MIVNSVNPFQFIFVHSFRVRNESGEHLKFWVAGTHESGNLYLLPLFLTSLPAFPKPGSEAFWLRHGDTTRVTYDADDQNFTVIIVRRANGELLALDVDLDKRRDDCCYPPWRAEYVLPPARAMRPLTAAERTAFDERSSGALALAVFLLPLLPVYFYRLQRRLGLPANAGRQ